RKLADGAWQRSGRYMRIGIVHFTSRGSASKAGVIQFSHRDRYGAFAHRKVAEHSVDCNRQLRRFRLLLIATFLIGFAVPFVVTFARDRFDPRFSTGAPSTLIATPSQSLPAGGPARRALSMAILAGRAA